MLTHQAARLAPGALSCIFPTRAVPANSPQNKIAPPNPARLQKQRSTASYATRPPRFQLDISVFRSNKSDCSQFTDKLPDGSFCSSCQTSPTGLTPIGADLSPLPFPEKRVP